MEASQEHIHLQKARFYYKGRQGWRGRLAGTTHPVKVYQAQAIHKENAESVVRDRIAGIGLATNFITSKIIIASLSTKVHQK